MATPGLAVRRKSHRTALLLDYSHGSKNFPQHFITGQVCQGALAFFPGASPLRARVVEPFTRGERFPLAELPLPDALHDMAQRLSANPWQWPLPLRVSEILIYPHESGWRFVSTQGQHLPTHLSSDEGWRLLAHQRRRAVYANGGMGWSAADAL